MFSRVFNNYVGTSEILRILWKAKVAAACNTVHSHTPCFPKAQLPHLCLNVSSYCMLLLRCTDSLLKGAFAKLRKAANSFVILIFCWPCISIYLFININQLDALNFIISLFQASTCFEHMCLSSGGQIVLYSLWYHHTETSEWSKITKIIKIIKILFYKYEHMVIQFITIPKIHTNCTTMCSYL